MKTAFTESVVPNPIEAIDQKGQKLCIFSRIIATILTTVAVEPDLGNSEPRAVLF